MSTAKELNIDGFSGGPYWCVSFLLRKHLSIQKLLADAQEKLLSFRDYMCQSWISTVFLIHTCTCTKSHSLSTSPWARPSSTQAVKELQSRPQATRKPDLQVCWLSALLVTSYPQWWCSNERQPTRKKCPSECCQQQREWLDVPDTEATLDRCLLSHPPWRILQNQEVHSGHGLNESS